jgi:plasmid stabilization system protein ParE
MPRLRVKVDPRAAEEIRSITRWWRENRPANPELLKRELAEARALLSEKPDVGAHVRGARSDVQRLLLLRTQYHIYYRVDRAAREVIIVAVWHTSRGSGPPL